MICANFLAGANPLCPEESCAAAILGTAAIVRNGCPQRQYYALLATLKEDRRSTLA